MPDAPTQSQTQRVYLDYGATTPLDPRVLEAMLPYLQDVFGNASSLHAEGKAAQAAVETSRHALAAALGIRDPHEIIFTSGGTESDAMAIRGIAHAARARLSKSKGPGHVVCSAFEHKAVLQAVAGLHRSGFESTLVEPRANGVIDPDDIAAALRPDTVLVSVMMLNNEVGTVQDIGQMAQVAHRNGAAFHTDAVAALGKVPIDVGRLGVDALTFTAHKICGPKGAGALYLSKRVPFEPLIVGGGQQHGKRGGTYDTASIVGFAQAVQLALDPHELQSEAARLCGLRDWLVSRLSQHPRIDTVVPIAAGDVLGHAPGLVPLLVDGLESETMLQRLDDAGFAISGGSACTAASNKPSYVLESMGIDSLRASGFLRVTMGRFTTRPQVEAFARALLDTVDR